MRYTAPALIMSLATAAALATMGTARADVYRSVDAQGHVQYSDTPSPGAELVHVQRSEISPAPAPQANAAAGNSAANPPRPVSPPSPAQMTARQNAGTQADLDRQRAQQAVQQDVESQRAEQCKKATDDYQSSIAARRIYRTGADGEREYLTDDQAEQQRVQLRQAMQTACGN